MPTPRKKTTAKKIDVNIQVERKLIDSKIALPDAPPQHRLSKIIVYSIILGGLAGAGLVFYLKISDIEPTIEYMPRITIPKDQSKKVVNPPAPTPAATPTITPPTAPPPAPVEVVEILSTPTGVLNVRKGPGTNFPKVAEVKPGEAYLLVSTDATSGWYEIKLANGSTGWIIKQYARVR